jgi:hypothetical protein
MLSTQAICQWCHAYLDKKPREPVQGNLFNNQPSFTRSDSAFNVPANITWSGNIPSGFPVASGVSTASNVSAFPRSESNASAFSENSSAFSFCMKKEDFCDNNYCEQRYHKEKSKIPKAGTHCTYCGEKKSYFSWSRGSNQFCSGKCIDLYDEMQVNSELRALKTKEKSLKDALEIVEQSLEKFEETMPFAKKA